MVFNCRTFYAVEVEEVPLLPAAWKKNRPDERKQTKKGSKQAAVEDRKNVAPKKVANEPKVAAKPVEKTVVQTGYGTQIKKRADPEHPYQAAATGPTPTTAPSVKEKIPPADKIQPPPPLKASPVNQPVHWKEIKVALEEKEQLRRRNQVPQLRQAAKLGSLANAKQSDDEDNNNKVDNLDSWNRKLKQDALPVERRANLVLKMGLHCEGCINRIRRAVEKFEGVKGISVDASRELVTVMGDVDAQKLIRHLQQKLRTKQDIEVINRPYNIEDAAAAPAGGGTWQSRPEVNVDDTNLVRKAGVAAACTVTGGRKLGQLTPSVAVQTSRGATGRATGDHREPDKNTDMVRFPEASASMLNLRLKLHCDGCIDRIHAAISPIHGVDLVNVNARDDLVTVMVAGKVDVRELVLHLKNKLKRDVEVVPHRKLTAPGDEMHRRQPPSLPVPVKPWKKSDEGRRLPASVARSADDKEKSPIKQASLPNQQKDAGVEKVRGYIGTNWSPPLTPWNDGVPVANYNEGSYGSYGYNCRGGYQRATGLNSLIDMFNDENANACSIM